MIEGRPVMNFLCLAATPTFAIMALLSAVLGGGAADMLCAGSAPLLTGMVPDEPVPRIAMAEAHFRTTRVIAAES